MPLELLDRIDSRLAAGAAADALAQAHPARVIFDLAAIDLRQTMWSLPVIDALRARFPFSTCEVRGTDPQRALVAAHLQERFSISRSCPPSAAPPMTVSFGPRAASKVRAHLRHGQLELVFPRSLIGSRDAHECVRCVQAASAMDLNPSQLAPSLRLPSWSRHEARALAKSLAAKTGGPLIALLPGSDACESWNPEHFRAAALQLLERMGGVALQWGGTGGGPIVYLQQLHPCVGAALLSLCAVCIADDHGWAHVAAAVGAPILTVHGPTDPDTSGPVSRFSAAAWTTHGTCERCAHEPRKHRCLQCLRPEPVVDMAERLAAERWPWDRLARWLP